MLQSLPNFSFQAPAVYSSDSAIQGLPIDVSSSLGRRLRELRRERNLAQRRVALDLGLDERFLSDVEQGKKCISLPLLQRVALGMDLSLSDLLQDL